MNSFTKAIALVTLTGGALVLIAPLASAAVPTPTGLSTVAAASAHPGTAIIRTKDGAPLIDTEKTMTNLTPFDMTLGTYYQKPGFYGPAWFPGETPSSGPTHTGGQNSWGITDWGFGDNNQWNVAYHFTDDEGEVMTATAAYVPNQQYPSLSTTTCVVTGSDSANYQCDVDANDGTFAVHPTENAMTLSQQDRNAFAHGLENLCSTGAYSCSFTPTSGPSWSQSAPYIPQSEHAVVGCKTGNSGVDAYSSSVSEASSVTDEIGESASVGFEDFANASVNRSISHTKTWQTTQGNEGSINLTAKAGQVAFVSETTGIESVTGTFTATVDGTTYTLSDVTISDPAQSNPDGTIQPFADAQSTRPMTAADWATCQGPMSSAR